MDRHQYEMLYRNQRPLDSSSDEEDENEETSDEEQTLEMNVKYTKKILIFLLTVLIETGQDYIQKPSIFKLNLVLKVILLKPILKI